MSYRHICRVFTANVTAAIMPSFTSYLKLNDRLSQIWLNTYTLALLLAMLKLLFFSNSIQNAIELSENYVISHCGTIDAIYSEGLNDTPHYLGKMGNYLIKEALVQSVNASLKTLSLLVYASEELLTFTIDLYLGTYACLLVSAIDGTVDVATNATESLIGFVNTSVTAFANELDDGLEDISDVINKVISAASKIESLFTDDDESPSANVAKVNLTIASLRNIYIPSSINDKLEQLSSNTPDFAQVKNITKNLISEPFEKVRDEINLMNSSNIVGNPNMLYVPPLSNGSTTSGICSSNEPNIRAIYKSLTSTLKVTTAIFIALIAVGALCAMLPMAWNEYKLWRRLCEMRNQYLEKQFFYNAAEEKNSSADSFEKADRNMNYDVIASHEQCFHHWNTRVSKGITNIFRCFRRGKLSNLQKVKIQWIVAYIASERALCVLGIGLLALGICILQFIILAILKKALHSNNSSTIDKFLNSTIVQSFEDDINVWSQQTNLYINSTENNMNQQAFGWIDTTTVSVNQTVNKMITEIDDTLANVFNGTLLYAPMKTVVGCVIENKLYMVEKAMTWIHDKAQFNLPRINASDINAAIKEQQTNGSTSTLSTDLSDISSEIRSALIKVLQSAHKTAMWELMVALIILFIWVLQIPIALAIILYRSKYLDLQNK